jgi:hypothetical protein
MNSKATRTRLMAFSPRPQHRAGAEGVAARAAQGVPIGDAEAKMVLHRLAFHLCIGVVVAESEGVLRLWTFVGDLVDFRKCGHGILPCEDGGD